jgi:predicted alpha/beta-fold hydrolase
MTEIEHQGLEKVFDVLQRTERDHRPVVLLTCGMAGGNHSQILLGSGLIPSRIRQVNSFESNR